MSGQTYRKPNPEADGSPCPVWRVQLTTGREVPTPAVDNRLLLVGGGFGSHDFYALDATSGERVWHLPTKDDGPTASVVDDGFAVFNTESCTVYVVETRTGRVAWERWLGDPLLAQPAVGAGRVFMVYPRAGKHWLGAFGLRTGEPLWEAELTHDVITAPVFAEERLWLSTFDGNVWCVDPTSGAVLWSRDMRATSAPWIWNGDAYVARRDRDAQHSESAGGQREPRERTSSLNRSGDLRREYAEKAAPYLAEKWGLAHKLGFSKLDASVGFSTPPLSAKVGAASKLFGEAHVSRMWRYQGSRPVVVDGVLFDTTGDRLEARNVETDSLEWSWSNAKGYEGERRLSAPAVANGRVWAGTWDGRVISWDAASGAVRWEVAVGAPCLWQPTVSNGWVYAGLADGSLVGVHTGDPADDGWSMWGGGPGHNGEPATVSRTPESARSNAA
jgi:Ca-activated chloride channel homolog